MQGGHTMNLADIDFEIGSVNPSGVNDIVFFIPKADISAWPVIENDFATATDVTNYVQYGKTGTTPALDFTLKTGKKWIRIYTTQGKGKITWEYQGETDCKMVTNKATLSYPRLTNEGRAFAKYASNGDFVFIVKHDGKYYVIGSPDYRATLTPNGDSGDAPGSAKGITVEIECPDVTPLPTYIGELVLSDGTLDCATGEFTPAES